jgi:hypothetical protein
MVQDQDDIKYFFAQWGHSEHEDPEQHPDPRSATLRQSLKRRENVCFTTLSL